MRNKTYEELIKDGWKMADHSMDNILIAMLNYIESEMTRRYQNLYQKEFESPFMNTGAEDIVTKSFTVRSFDWNVDGMNDRLPNFDADDIKIFWYKHSQRGLDVLIKDPNVSKRFCEMLNMYVNDVKKIYPDSKLAL